MPDIASISAITTSVKTAIDIAKTIKDVDVSLEKAELKMRVAELISALADAKIASAEIVESLHQKEAEIEELQKKLKFKEKLTRMGEAYFEVDKTGSPTGDPYCSNCWEIRQIAVHLKTADHAAKKECPSCKTFFMSRRVRLNSDYA